MLRYPVQKNILTVLPLTLLDIKGYSINLQKSFPLDSTFSYKYYLLERYIYRSSSINDKRNVLQDSKLDPIIYHLYQIPLRNAVHSRSDPFQDFIITRACELIKTLFKFWKMKLNQLNLFRLFSTTTTKIHPPTSTPQLNLRLKISSVSIRSRIWLSLNPSI